MIGSTTQEVADFRPGIYQHWKGHLYRALFLAQDSTNRPSSPPEWSEVPGVRVTESSDEPMVIYISLNEPHSGNVCARELWQWNELVKWPENKEWPRFRWMHP